MAPPTLIRPQSYLGIADSDYVSARLLLLSGLPFTAIGKAMEAIEKQLTLFFMLVAKIEQGVDLSARDMVDKAHNLREMVVNFHAAAPAQCQISDTWKPFLETWSRITSDVVRNIGRTGKCSST